MTWLSLLISHLQHCKPNQLRLSLWSINTEHRVKSRCVDSCGHDVESSGSGAYLPRNPSHLLRQVQKWTQLDNDVEMFSHVCLFNFRCKKCCDEQRQKSLGLAHDIKNGCPYKIMCWFFIRPGEQVTIHLCSFTTSVRLSYNFLSIALFKSSSKASSD